ncbi:MAG TPA: CRISPR-associated helicase Cas3' [Balneolaceae bacterium]|nr:CRISPR-associated helicase Cas3' [Balneolaceae bacterium]
MRWTLDKYQELPLLAKSEVYGGVSLRDHLCHVGSAIEKTAQNLGENTALAKNGALLHDIGKAHPTYQGFVHDCLNIHDLARGVPHRHELSSLAFLPLFEQKDWPALIEMIVAHHKSVIGNSSDRGLLDIINRHGPKRFFDRHLKDWDVWSPRALKVLEELDIKVYEISSPEAQNALEWTIGYCENLDDGWSKWKGVLMASDHMASALNSDLKSHLKHLFNNPKLKFPHEPNKLYPLSLKSTDDERSHTLVVAPTGAGKTDFLLKRCRGRIFYVLPFQASINAMYQRIRKMTTEETDVRLLHSNSKLVADDETRQRVQLQPFVGASIKVLTPHQISNVIFGSMGFEANLLDLGECDIILDEVHTYEAETQAMVVEIVKVLLKHNCRIHIGTATMPTALYENLQQLMGGENEVYEVNLSEKELATYDRHFISKYSSFDKLHQTIDEALEKQEKVLIVCNTVKRSQQIFDELSALFADIPKMLLHSRFRRKDRREREDRLEKEFNEGEGPCIVVSTQVVEVSLDINFDRMITQAAPIDALIQRFGRVNRKRQPKKEQTFKPIHVIEPDDNTLPYSKEIVDKSFELLPDEALLKTNEIQDLIDQVYPEVTISEISAHCCWKEGNITLKKLRHITEPILLKLLEINSATCILGQDYEEYMDADWKERQWLEIPVNQKSLYGYEGSLQTAEAGSEPYIMDGQDQYDMLGLQLKQSSNFI